MKVTSAVILGSMLVMSGSAVYAQGGAQASFRLAAAPLCKRISPARRIEQQFRFDFGAGWAEVGITCQWYGDECRAFAALDAKKTSPAIRSPQKRREATKSEDKVVIPRGTKLSRTRYRMQAAQQRRKRIGTGHRVR